MPKISIVRPANEWTNQQRKTYIYIDREKVGHVESGQTAQFEVLPGKHKVVVVLKQRWAGGSKVYGQSACCGTDISGFLYAVFENSSA